MFREQFLVNLISIYQGKIHFSTRKCLLTNLSQLKTRKHCSRYQPPACQPYMLHNEQVWTCPGIRVWWGPFWINSNMSEGESLSGDVQYIMGNGHMGPPCGQTERQTRLKTLLSPLRPTNTPAHIDQHTILSVKVMYFLNDWISPLVKFTYISFTSILEGWRWQREHNRNIVRQPARFVLVLVVDSSSSPFN